MTGQKSKDTIEPIKEAAQSMTLHGLPRLLQCELKCMKVVWLLIILAALGLLVTLATESVAQYQKHEVYLKVTSKIMQPLPFPAITVCNSDRFSVYGFPQLPTGNISCNEIENSTGFMKLDTKQKIELKIACKMFLSGYKDTIRFGGKAITGFPSSFTYTGQFFPCFTFNKNGLVKQLINRAGMGLDMILFHDPDDAIDFSTINVSRFDDRRSGLTIKIHDPATMDSIDPSSGIMVLPGHSHEIVMSRKTISRKAHPFPSNCHTEKSTPYKSLQGRYTTPNCLLACFETKLLKKCGIGLLQKKSKSQVECEEELLQQEPHEDCVCPQPCYEITYPTKIAINVWPRKQELTRMTTEFAGLLNLSQATTTDYIQSRFSKVKIYYEDLINTDATEEEFYGFSNLISEIGGIMGFFLGCSVISLAELLWLFGLSVLSIFKCIGTRQLNIQTEKDHGQNMEIGFVNAVIRDAS